MISASKDALWILDESRKVYKFDEVHKMFVRKGNEQSYHIEAGLNG